MVLFIELDMEMLMRPSVWPRLVVRVISREFMASVRLVSAISVSLVSEDLVVTVEAGPVTGGLMVGPGDSGLEGSSLMSRSGSLSRRGKV